MRDKYVFASLKAPMVDSLESFIASVKEGAEKFDCKIIAMRGQAGPGCYNIAVIVEGEHANNEQFGMLLSMALQPARWANCGDPDWEGFDDWRDLK